MQFFDRTFVLERSPSPCRAKPAAAWLLLLGFTVVGSAIMGTTTGCSKSEKEPEPTVEVQAEKVESRAIEQVVEVQAVLFPLSQAAIVPKVSAPIRKILVARGQRVHQGQLLAELESRDLAAATVESKGLYEQAQAAYETRISASLPQEIQKAEYDAQEAKQQLEVEQKVFDSRQNLFNQGALPRKELDRENVALLQAKNLYAAAQRHLDALRATGKQSELKAAAGQLAAAKGKNLQTEAQLSYAEIRSPIEGTVTDRPLYPGEMAAAGAPLITVMDLSRVTARAHIPQEAAAALKPGSPATIQVPGQEEAIAAKVTMIAPATDANSTTVEVWVEAKNDKQNLRPGSSVKVGIVGQRAENALVIPKEAVLTSAETGTTVMVIGSDSKAHQRKVTTGISDGKDVQIVEGVKAGEQVVVGGAYGLPDNTKVTVSADKGDAEKKAGETKIKEYGKDKNGAGKKDE